MKPAMQFLLVLSILVIAILVLKIFLSGISTGKAVDFMRSGAVLIDVRSEAEFNTGSIDTAVNIPYDRITEKIVSVIQDENTPVLLFCHSGSRAALARQSLKKAGYTNVYSIGTVTRARKLYRQAGNK
jgi:phage shock protein E